MEQFLNGKETFKKNKIQTNNGKGHVMKGRQSNIFADPKKVNTKGSVWFGFMTHQPLLVTLFEIRISYMKKWRNSSISKNSD